MVKEKKINVLTVFFISHKNDITIFLKWKMDDPKKNSANPKNNRLLLMWQFRNSRNKGRQVVLVVCLIS